MKKTKKTALKALDLFEEDEQELETIEVPEKKKENSTPLGLQSLKSKNGRILVGTLSLLLVVGISSAVILQSKPKEAPNTSFYNPSQGEKSEKKKESEKKEGAKKEEATKQNSETKSSSAPKPKAPVNKETAKEAPAPPVYRNIPPTEPIVEATGFSSLDAPSTQTLSSTEKEGALTTETVPIIVDMITIDLIPYIGQSIDGVPEDLSAQGATVIVEYKEDDTHPSGCILEVFGQDTTARFIVAQ